MGLVNQVFSENEKIDDLPGEMAVGHVRYATAGSKGLENAQPVVTQDDEITFAHNGNITNAEELRELLAEMGVDIAGVIKLPDEAKKEPSGESDSQLAAALLWAAPGETMRDKLRWLYERVEGAFSAVVMTPEAIYGMKDRHGFRPLSVGERETDGEHVWGIASETCALLTTDVTHNKREVLPGEVVQIDHRGIRTILYNPAENPSFCLFEHVYLARPDSELGEDEVHISRTRMGRQLAREAPVADADVVIGVPDSGIFAARGYAHELGLPYEEGFAKNRYIGRTFIDPTPDLREQLVRLKLNSLRANVRGKKIVVIDDSLVRGNTAPQIVDRLMRDGAVEVHLRIASPPLRHPCHMGVDMPTHEEFLANQKDLEEIRRVTKAKSLAYLSYEGLLKATGEAEHTSCGACFTGRYPIDIKDSKPGSGG